MGTGILAYVDKTVVKIRGIEVKGLKPYELEKRIEESIDSRVRIIGVTGSSIDMDVYGLDADAIFENEKGIIEAVSITDGISAKDVIKIASAEKILEVDYDDIPRGDYTGCLRERWLKFEKKD